jgi:hypothetical protein
MSIPLPPLQRRRSLLSQILPLPLLLSSQSRSENQLRTATELCGTRMHMRFHFCPRFPLQILFSIRSTPRHCRDHSLDLTPHSEPLMLQSPWVFPARRCRTYLKMLSAEETANGHDTKRPPAGRLVKSSSYIESLPDGSKKTIEPFIGAQKKQGGVHSRARKEGESSLFWLSYPSCLTVTLNSPYYCPSSPSWIIRELLAGLNKWAFLDLLPIQTSLP